MKHPTYLLIIAGLLFLSLHFYERLQSQRRNNDITKSILREKTDSVAYWKNKHGQVVSEKAAAEIRAKDFEEHYQEDVKHLKEELNISTKELKAYVKAQLAAQGTGSTTIVHNHYIDSTGAQVVKTGFNIDDGYLALDAAINGDQVDYNYTYNDDFIYAFHTKKDWFFGKEKLYGSGQLSNPNARITNATNVLINDYRDKRWVVSAGVSYLPFLPESPVQLSVTFGYALIKF